VPLVAWCRARPNRILGWPHGSAGPGPQRTAVRDPEVPVGEMLAQHLVVGAKHGDVDVLVRLVPLDVECPATGDPPVDRQSGEQAAHVAGRQLRPSPLS
jgi:hypothetical protein